MLICVSVCLCVCEFVCVVSESVHYVNSKLSIPRYIWSDMLTANVFIHIPYTVDLLLKDHPYCRVQAMWFGPLIGGSLYIHCGLCDSFLLAYHPDLLFRTIFGVLCTLFIALVDIFI